MIDRCVICGRLYSGHGHNAEPVTTGLCCTVCNDVVVIPERIARIGRSELDKMAAPGEAQRPTKEDDHGKPIRKPD